MQIKEQIIKSKAIYSDDEKYRYSLTKTWNESKSKATFIGINPSDATELIMDKTVMNLMNHLISNGYGKVEIVNLFAYRSKDQKKLVNSMETQEAMNVEYILRALEDSELIIVGWGRAAEKKPKYREALKSVKNILKEKADITKCFKDKKGNINCHLSIGYSKEWSLVEYPLGNQDP